jgi:predicted Fe-Mo cluster-binding NifX family protein
LERADKIGRALEQELSRSIPFLERILLDVKPARRDNVLFALPLQATAGPASKHFGTAPHFLFLERRREDGTVARRSIIANPFASDPKGRGIKVANWLLEERIDILATLDDIRKKGPGYALKEAGVQIHLVAAESVESALSVAVGEVQGNIIAVMEGD